MVPAKRRRDARPRVPRGRMLWPMVAALLWLTAGVIANAQPGKIKLLIIEGISNHDWRHRVEIVRAILARDGSFEVDVTVTPSAAGDPGWATWRPNFAAYDVVLSGYNNLGGQPRWPAEVEASFETYLRGGGGFFVYHEANNSFATWAEYNRMIGLGWRGLDRGNAIIVNPDETLQYVPPGAGSATSHGARVDVLVRRLGTHPIHQGLPPAWMAADLEIYRYARGPATNLTVLSYALDPATQLQFPIEWVVHYGQGRSYVSSYGHVWADDPQPKGARCAAFQTVLVRALKWLAGRYPGATVPADFPTTNAISLRPYATGVNGLDQAQAVGAFANGTLPTQSKPPGNVLIQRAFTNLVWESPIELKPWPNSSNLLLIAEMDGRIFRVPNDDSTTNRTLVLDIRDRAWYYNWTTGDPSTKHGGMQSIVFHPRFGSGEGKDYIYLFYLFHPTDQMDAAPPYYDRLSRFTWNPATATFDPASEQILINQYDTEKGHDGGGMAFGSDGFLYIGFGDEGTQDGASTPHTQKINDRVRSGVWRLDVDQQGGSVSHSIRRQPVNLQPSHGSFTQGYYVPTSNPWQDPTGGTLEEFFAIGLRQPHRLSFDAVSGLFWIGDVGGGQREEIDVLDGPGLNFQWNYTEGTASGFRPVPSPLIGTERAPVHDYNHGLGNCVIGGFVYRGQAIPWLNGRFLYGDNGSQRIYALEYDPLTRTRLSIMEIGQGRSGGLFSGLASFGVDAGGEPFILQLGAGSNGNGTISRLKPNPAVVDHSRFPSTLAATGLFTNLATLAPAPGLIPFEVNMPLWSDGAEKRRWLLIPNDGHPDTPAEQIVYSETGPWVLPPGSVLVKHFSLPGTGRKLETRVLVRGNDGAWAGVTYKWLPGEGDAILLEQGGTETLTMPGETFEYLYPSRGQCSICHNVTAGPLLGLSTRQFNRRITYPATGRSANQIETLSALGFIPTALTEVDLLSAITSASRDGPPVSNERFVRSYLDANCAQCHQPGASQALFDARLTTPLASQNLWCGPVRNPLGRTAPAVLKPGVPADSMLFLRLNTIDPCCAMPPLGKGRIDQRAVTTLANWILGMPADACTGYADSDADGLPDPWELAFTTNLNQLTFSGDADGDGLTDAAERATGTNPLDAASRFQVRELRPVPGSTNFSAAFDSVPGREYRIWVSSDLRNWNDCGWVPAADWPANKTVFQISAQKLSATAGSRLFLRASVVQVQ